MKIANKYAIALFCEITSFQIVQEVDPVSRMKFILVIGDGMADYPIPELGNKTPLQAAFKPNMDAVAARGRNGLIKNVPDDLTPSLLYRQRTLGSAFKRYKTRQK